MAQSLVQVHLTVQTQIYEAPVFRVRSIFMYLAMTVFISCCQINATASQPVIKVKTLLELFQYQTTVISLQFRF